MPIDRTGDPWPKTSCDDDAGPPEPQPAPETPSMHRPSTLALMLGGVAGALVLGVLFGLWARPELIGSKPMAPAAPAPAVAAPPRAAQVPLVVAPPQKAEPPPRAPGRLETLPPEMAAAARTQVLPSIPPIDSGTTAGESPEAAETPPSPSYAASFDCATARPGAEEIVCEDPALAAADRRMARAYARAMRSGVDPEDLRQEQRDWTAIREDAAMESRQALAQAYDQRIRELNQIAQTATLDDGH